MVDQQNVLDSQLPLGMSYSTAYSLGIEANPGYTTSTVQNTSDYREGSKDSDQEDGEGRRRGGTFERDLRGDRESRRYAPYSTGRGKGRISSSALKELRVYVSNLPYSTRWQELKDYMKKIGDVTFVEIFEDEKGRSKGCGVVEFKTKEDAEKAIQECNGKDFSGRPLQVREDRVEEDSRMHRSKLRGNTIAQSSGPTNVLSSLPAILGLGNAGLSNKNDPTASTVFVSNLDYKVTWQKLKDAFRVAGNVVRANIKEDENQKSKGYGTVQFETPLEALNAVNMLNGHMIMDRSITVRMDRNASFQGGSRTSNQSLASNPLASTTGNPMALLNILQSLQGLTALAQLGNLGGSNLGGGLGSTSTNQALGVMNSLPGNTTGSAAGAMGLDAASNLAALSSLGGIMNQLATPASASTLSYGMGSSTHTDNSSGKQIFVRNLPWKYTWQDLKDKFRAAGKVTRADILTESGGRSKGCGIVVFDTQEEAQRAIAMFNGMSCDGREIDVRLDRFG